MAIRRQSNSDYMSREMDKELEEMERRIHTLYQDADTELRRRLSDYLSQYEEDNQDMRERLENGDISQEEYERWANSRIIRSQRYERQIDALADVLVNTDVAAMALVNENLPAVIGNSYNFIASLGFQAAEEAGLSVGNFQIYNARSVQMLIRENPDILPVVDVPEDERWNRSRINREITQAIIQGDTIPQVADRLQRVTNMDNNAAVRNARTAMTASENMGRAQASRRLRDAGVPNREVWSATMDNRTRDTHLLLDGTYANEDGYFGEGILHPDHLMRFPADPNGEPQEVYNCRCRLSIQLEGIDHSQDGDLYRQFMEENYPDDYASLQARDEETGRTQRRQEAINRIPQARERVQSNLEERLRQERGEQTQPLFVPAQSVEEAQQRARDAGAIYSKFDGWDIGRANNALEAVERLPEDCRPRAVLDGRDTATITDRSLGRRASSWYGVTYDYRPFTLRTMQLGFDRTDYDGGQVVGLNVRTFKTLEQLTSAKVKTNDSYFANNGRYWFFNTRGEATAHHEMGHCLFNVRIAGNDSIRNEWESASRRWYNESTCDLIEKPEEAFAEAWAAVAIGDEERLPSYIVDFVRRYL